MIHRIAASQLMQYELLILGETLMILLFWMIIPSSQVLILTLALMWGDVSMVFDNLSPRAPWLHAVFLIGGVVGLITLATVWHECTAQCG